MLSEVELERLKEIREEEFYNKLSNLIPPHVNTIISETKSYLYVDASALAERLSYIILNEIFDDYKEQYIAASEDYFRGLSDEN